MRGLALVDGDLVLSGGDYVAYSGTPKIRQDLTLALSETYGADPYHPYWGSVLQQYLGKTSDPVAQQAVTNEINRILSNYLAVQTDQINKTIINGTRGVYQTGDVVQSVQSVDVQVIADGIFVNVLLQTMTGQTVAVQQTLTNS